MGEYVNIHGRRGGRGVRPWLLIPKYLCVAMVLGGIVSAGTVLRQLYSTPAADQRAMLDVIGRLFTWQVVPATIGAIILGGLLLLQHPRELLRMRWLQVKLALLIAGIPLVHVVLSGSLADLREQPEGSGKDFGRKLAMAAMLLVVVIIIGRLKPRLGQLVKSDRHADR